MKRAVTNTEQAVIDFIAAAAERGEKCPSNTVIADHIGYGLTNISSLLKTIEAKGAITVERGNNKRVVTIVATGARTAGETGPSRRASRRTSSAIRLARASARPSEAEIFDRAERVDMRDPCFGCGVPYDRHDRDGCKRWRGA